MSFIMGVFVIIVLPIILGYYLDSKFNHSKAKRRFRKDLSRLLSSYWAVGIVPACGIIFLFVFFSIIGRVLLLLF